MSSLPTDFFLFLFFFWETIQKQVFEKHIIALNRLAAIANLPGTQELSPSIAQILQERNSKQSILLNYRKINNSSVTGLLDTHISTSAHEEVPPNPANIQAQQTLPIFTHHSHAQLHTTGTPLRTTSSEAHHLQTQIHQQQVLDFPTDFLFFDTPNLEPQTPTVSFLRVTRVTRWPTARVSG